jgi:two-component system, NarL family, nitrate/nitrite response regulator NarL
LFAEAIRSALEDAGMEAAAVVTSGRSALAYLEDDRPDLVLLDVGLPDRSGLAVGREILDWWPDAKLVVVTALDDPKAVEEASRAGFRGYLTKDTPVSRFVSSIEAIVAGQTVFPHRLANPSRRSGSGDSAWLLISQLTPREREVLGLLVEGANGRTIADRLAISRNTVRTHVQSILTKLQVHSRLEAATLAVRHRVVPIPSTVGPDSVVERSVPRKSAADRSRITRTT